MARSDFHAIRDHVRDSDIFNRRTLIAGMLVMLLLLGLLGRLFFLQVTGHEHFATLSQANRVNIAPISPTRGLIYDRNGVLLAENVPTYSLEVIPEQVKDLDGTLARLDDLLELTDEEVERFREEVGRTRSFQRVPLRSRLSDEEVARFAINRHEFPGVDIEARLARHYPQGELTAHTVGYMGRIGREELQRLDRSVYRGTSHIGKVGVERSYEKVLHGRAGHQQVETNAQGRILRVLERTSPEPGRDIRLSIDTELTRVAHEAFGDEYGALIALEPDTGEVLALASVPSFDPNVFIRGFDASSRELFTDSRERPLFNRAISGRYPPGSITKPIIALAGLEQGHFRPDETIQCKGYYEPEFEDQRVYRDWKRSGHGPTDMRKAVAESCDVYFYELSYRMGIDELAPMLREFGFGSRTGIDLMGERSGLVPDREWKQRNQNVRWFPGETLITGIGQGYLLATPLQLATSTAILANGGKRVTPNVVREIEGDAKLPKPLPEPLDLEPDRLERVVDAMEDVIHGRRGTARDIGWRINYRMAGKTGTAQVFGLGEEREYDPDELAWSLHDHSLFVGFAPADDPEIVVAVIAEHGGGGSTVAAPIAEKVITHYLISQGITEPLPAPKVQLPLSERENDPPSPEGEPPAADPPFIAPSDPWGDDS
ncbi:MAG: penicillin-binding protein 2 [Pseudomonadota bacterium]